jgi:hypothetical protein
LIRFGLGDGLGSRGAGDEGELAGVDGGTLLSDSRYRNATRSVIRMTTVPLSSRAFVDGLIGDFLEAGVVRECSRLAGQRGQ